MADDEWHFTESGPTKDAAIEAAEALAREHFRDQPLPKRLDTRVLVGGQIDERQRLVGDGTWTVQLVYPVTDGQKDA